MCEWSSGGGKPFLRCCCRLCECFGVYSVTDAVPDDEVEVVSPVLMVELPASVGPSEGKTAKVGDPEGSSEAAGVGAGVGDMEGDSVGEAEGAGVGDLVGAEVPATGAAVGAEVGEPFFGALVFLGFLVGAMVGALVDFTFLAFFKRRAGASSTALSLMIEALADMAKRARARTEALYIILKSVCVGGFRWLSLEVLGFHFVRLGRGCSQPVGISILLLGYLWGWWWVACVCMCLLPYLRGFSYRAAP